MYAPGPLRLARRPPRLAGTEDDSIVGLAPRDVNGRSQREFVSASHEPIMRARSAGQGRACGERSERSLDAPERSRRIVREAMTDLCRDP